MSYFSPEIWPAVLALTVVAAMFALFVTELYSTETVAIGGASVLLASGVLSLNDMLEAVANPAPLAIAAMFIISGALVRTGALGAATAALTKSVEKKPRTTIIALGLFIISASAFMNNTPVVLILIPVAAQLSGG